MEKSVFVLRFSELIFHLIRGVNTCADCLVVAWKFKEPIDGRIKIVRASITNGTKIIP